MWHWKFREWDEACAVCMLIGYLWVIVLILIFA